MDREQKKRFYEKHHLDVQTEQRPSSEVNFEKLFQDQLPAEALDLGEFLRKYKEKDESKEFDIDTTKKGANDKLRWANEFLPKGDISAWMLADTEVLNAYKSKL